MLVEDCVAKSGAKKLYIMLGMNDLGVYGIDKTIENYKTLLGKILEKTPDIKIYVQSMTPMTSTSQIIGKNLNNENIKKYNRKAFRDVRGKRMVFYRRCVCHVR